MLRIETILYWLILKINIPVIRFNTEQDSTSPVEDEKCNLDEFRIIPIVRRLRSFPGTKAVSLARRISSDAPLPPSAAAMRCNLFHGGMGAGVLICIGLNPQRAMHFIMPKPCGKVGRCVCRQCRPAKP